MNNSQPESGSEPGAAASPEGRWIGAELAGSTDAVGSVDPVAATPDADAAARPSGMFGVAAAEGAAADPEPEPQEAPTGARPSGRRDRSHLRLVSDPAADPAVPLPEAEPAVPAPAPVPVAVPDEPVAAAPVPPAAAAPAFPEPVPNPTPPARFRVRAELGSLLGIVLIGTAAAVGVDALLGGLNGMPPAYLLVFLASPIWDFLPRRLPARITVIAGHAAATAGVWLALAALPMQQWLRVDRATWRAELAFGAACLLVGAVHLLLAAALRPARPRAVP